MVTGECFTELAGYGGGNDGITRIDSATLSKIINQEGTELVAGNELPSTVGILGGNANAVAVRIGGDKDITIGCAGELKELIKGHGKLRIWGGNGWKMAIRCKLIFNHMHRHAGFLQNLAYRQSTHAVKRCVADSKRRLWVGLQWQYGAFNGSKIISQFIV